MSLFLLFFVAVVFLAAVAVFVKRARAGKVSVFLRLVAGVSVGAVVALIGCLGFMGGGTRYSEYDSEEDETLAAIQDSIADGHDAFDRETETEVFVVTQDTIIDMHDAFGCGEDGPAGMCSGEAPEYTAIETVADAVQSGFAPGISDWSDCDRFFVSADGFRNVHFFINNGDRCIRVSTSPVTLPGLYAYVGTFDGWHRFRQYMLKGEAQKMETKDLAGNPMTIKIPVICGANTKYIRVYSDDYVFISEDAGRFSSDGESFSGVEKEVFWTIWKKCFGEDWHLMAGSAGGAPAGNRQTESSGSISDYGVNKCKYCGGSGWCSKCGGRGYVDFMGDIQDCPSCRGFKHCFNCGGSGLQI
mgnify:CR=1 FL=1